MADRDMSTGEARQRASWGIGIALGMGVGVATGSALDNMGLGIAIGIAIGIAFALAFGAAGHRQRPDARADDIAADQTFDDEASGAGVSDTDPDSDDRDGGSTR